MYQMHLTLDMFDYVAPYKMTNSLQYITHNNKIFNKKNNFGIDSILNTFMTC